MTGCQIVELSATLLNEVECSPSSLVTVPETEEEVIICSGFDSSCESFDGSNSIRLSNTKVKHEYSCMALYDNQATVIAGQTNSVEELYFRLISIFTCFEPFQSGWRDQPAHPISNLYGHACVSMKNGIITAGGYDGSNYIMDVYLFRNVQWSVVGQVKEV